MSADRFAEVERLYHEAKKLPSQERAPFLDEACGGDAALRREVESLLSLRTDANGFLSRPAIEEAARMNPRPWGPDSWPTIPGYTIRQVLGEGGMGVVYLAEQETPFRRLVALKLIKPGMDTRQVVARFETERQALALMDHPNIAAVFDAGSTQDGRPYFVMEFVDGVALTDYCDRERLSTRDRLALFVQVCAAVQHAHQKGVIHRDLKPSNVLVAERDGRAVPKVIDFGTAKAVGGTWNATATQFGQGMVLGTLEYMSPEQAALSADIDTATDVYSLGVLLYELLVGRLPFDTEELREAGYDEIRRVIRESDPPRPSVRAGQRSEHSGPAALARQTDALGLTRQLRGDLDWIVLKALEKDRKRRYATVAALATDIGRFLGDQPVDARPPSSTYRIRKFTRRHRLAVAAAATIFTMLGVGVTAITGLYFQADASRREADRQRQSASQEREQALSHASRAERAAAEANEQRGKAVDAQADADSQRQQAERAAADADAQRGKAVAAQADADSQRQQAERAAADANAQRGKAVAAQADADSQRQQAVSALRESSYLGYTNTLAAAADDLRNGDAADAQARLRDVPEAQRGWEWQHLFIQTDESVFTLASSAPPCEGSVYALGPSVSRTTLNVDTDSESILLRRCMTVERWNVAKSAHTIWTSPPGTLWILAENARGQILTLAKERNLVLTDRSGLAPAVTFQAPLDTPICADISPDGARIAVGLDRIGALADVFEVWNTATRQRQFRLNTTPPSRPDIRPPGACSIRFSPDGRRIATSGSRVQIWDAATGVELAADPLRVEAYKQAIAFSRGGDRLAIGRPTGLVDVVDLRQSPPTLRQMAADGGRVEELLTEQDRLRSKRAVVALAFSPDDKTVVSGTSKSVGVWDIAHSRLVRVLSGHAADVLDVEVSGDGRLIYSVDAAGVVRGWASSSAPAVARIPGSFDLFRASAGTTIVATATSDNALTAIRLADLHQEVIRAGTGRWDYQGPFAVAPNGLSVFAAESGGVRRFRLGSRETVAISTEYSPTLLAVSPGNGLLALFEGSHLAVWDASTMKQLAEVDMAADPMNLPRAQVQNAGRGVLVVPPTDLAFRDEDTLIISTATTQPSHQSLVRIWNWRTNRVLAKAEPEPDGGHGVPWRLALSPDGRIALISTVAGKQSTVSLWDRDLTSEVGRLPPGDYHAIAFSPDGRRLVTVGAEENAVRIWDADLLRLLLVLHDVDSHWGGVAFTAAGQLVAGRTTGGLTIWDTQIRRR